MCKVKKDFDIIYRIMELRKYGFVENKKITILTNKLTYIHKKYIRLLLNL